MELFGGFMIMLWMIGFFLTIIWFILPFVIFSIKSKVDGVAHGITQLERRLIILENTILASQAKRHDESS